MNVLMLKKHSLCLYHNDFSLLLHKFPKPKFPRMVLAGTKPESISHTDVNLYQTSAGGNDNDNDSDGQTMSSTLKPPHGCCIVM